MKYEQRGGKSPKRKAEDKDKVEAEVELKVEI